MRCAIEGFSNIIKKITWIIASPGEELRGPPNPFVIQDDDRSINAWLGVKYQLIRSPCASIFQLYKFLYRYPKSIVAKLINMINVGISLNRPMIFLINGVDIFIQTSLIAVIIKLLLNVLLGNIDVNFLKNARIKINKERIDFLEWAKKYISSDNEGQFWITEILKFEIWWPQNALK